MDPVIAASGAACLIISAVTFTVVFRRVMRGDADGFDIFGLLLPGWAAVFGVALLVLAVVVARI